MLKIWCAQVICADPLGIAYLPELQNNTDLCDGSDLHIGPGEFNGLATGAVTTQLVTARCPGAGCNFAPSCTIVHFLAKVERCEFDLKVRQRQK